jgi:hypothetical protein
MFGSKVEKLTEELRGLHRGKFNPLTPELNPSAQRWLTRIFTGDFTS